MRYTPDGKAMSVIFRIDLTLQAAGLSWRIVSDVYGEAQKGSFVRPNLKRSGWMIKKVRKLLHGSNIILIFAPCFS